ncbi:unnamed protein product [Adineta ricciae]|uniref:Protein kinase domain-containing protein n=1 Tax=Adineta ricciae TaxID=249248 RepID=A0A813N4Y2_ADIRI|nr:unnamed protein product [Adineta ricciae]CAF1233171.1 unnamed protein product [Adineta ricciae]
MSSSTTTSSQSPHHSSSAKHADLHLLTPLSSLSRISSPSTPLPQSTDPSGPLTPDSGHFINPFAALATANLPTLPSVRVIGEYEFSETKFDDFKCARHIPTGEALLYKEFSLEIVRQRLEPYQRLISILQLSNTNSQLTVEQLAYKYHIHFFRDIISLDRTAIVLYPNYTNNLHQYITEKHRLHENETRNLFSQVVRAVQLCHRVGLIVRDLKLRKIIFQDQTHTHSLLTGIDEAIMLATPTTTDDHVSSRFSCPVYACPEIVLNRQTYSGKMADSWSLGIILYTMLFGRYPFCDRTLVGLFIKIGRCRPDIPRTISLKARSLLRSLIRVKPDERLLTQDILGHVWFGGERSASTLSMSTSVSNSSINEDIVLSNNNLGCMNTSPTNDMTTKEDAVVPNFECE